MQGGRLASGEAGKEEGATGLIAQGVGVGGQVVMQRVAILKTLLIDAAQQVEGTGRDTVLDEGDPAIAGGNQVGHLGIDPTDAVASAVGGNGVVGPGTGNSQEVPRSGTGAGLGFCGNPT